MGGRFDHFATTKRLDIGSNLGKHAAPLWGGRPPCCEFAQRRTYRVFAIASIGSLLGWACLSDDRRIGGRLCSLCLASRPRARAVGRDLHVCQSDHRHRIGMGGAWRTSDVADVGWVFACRRFRHRGVATRSVSSGREGVVSEGSTWFESGYDAGQESMSIPNISIAGSRWPALAQKSEFGMSARESSVRFRRLARAPETV